MAAPDKCTLTGKVTYSDGTLFDGNVLLLIALPAGYSTASVSNQLIVQDIGDHVKVRVQQGVYDASAKIYQNASIQPPNTKYWIVQNSWAPAGASRVSSASSAAPTIAASSWAPLTRAAPSWACHPLDVHDCPCYDTRSVRRRGRVAAHSHAGPLSGSKRFGT